MDELEQRIKMQQFQDGFMRKSEEEKAAELQAAMAFQPKQLGPTPTPVTPEMQVLLERKAKAYYDSPEARAIRAKYDPDERAKQEANLAELAGVLRKK